MSKQVGGIELSDDIPVTEYDGKFSGTFELDVERAKNMGYDDTVYFVVTTRLDSYSFKPTKYGDLKRVNTFKVDHVRAVHAADLNKLQIQVGDPVAEITNHQQEFKVQEELHIEVDPRYYHMSDPSGPGNPNVPEETPEPAPEVPDEDDREFGDDEPYVPLQRPSYEPEGVLVGAPPRPKKDSILARFLEEDMR